MNKHFFDCYDATLDTFSLICKNRRFEENHPKFGDVVHLRFGDSFIIGTVYSCEKIDEHAHLVKLMYNYPEIRAFDGDAKEIQHKVHE